MIISFRKSHNYIILKQDLSFPEILMMIMTKMIKMPCSRKRGTERCCFGVAWRMETGLSLSEEFFFIGTEIFWSYFQFMEKMGVRHVIKDQQEKTGTNGCRAFCQDYSWNFIKSDHVLIRIGCNGVNVLRTCMRDDIIQCSLKD